jgi:hypothetical protein
VSDTPFTARRVSRTYVQTIDAPPDTVFPLLCPEREKEWLDGWQYSMVFSSSGLAEPGAVFTTSNPGEPETTWIVTRHDRDAGLVEFARFTPGSRTCLLQIGIVPFGDGRSRVTITYTYTSLSPAGDQFLDAWTEDAFVEPLSFWERSMNHFLATGTRLPRHAVLSKA